MTLEQMLLRTAVRHRIDEPDADAGIARLSEILGLDISPAALHDAVGCGVASGHFRDPVRLPAGALQCHWVLELTAQGVAAALSDQPADASRHLTSRTG